MAGKLLLKIRDKRLEGEEFVRNRKRYKLTQHFALVHFRGFYADQHKERVEYHRQRVAGDERLLRDNGINPNKKGSAWKFDKLIKRIK